MKAKTGIMIGCCFMVAALVGMSSLAYAASGSSSVPVTVNKGYQRGTSGQSCNWDDFNSDLFLMPRYFDRLMRSVQSPRVSGNAQGLDVIQTDNEYIILMDVPGMTKEELDVQLKDGILTVAGEREDTWNETLEGTGRYVYRNAQKYGRFSRALQLPDDLNVEEVHASYENWVLEITISYDAVDEESVINVIVT